MLGKSTSREVKNTGSKQESESLDLLELVSSLSSSSSTVCAAYWRIQSLFDTVYNKSSYIHQMAPQIQYHSMDMKPYLRTADTKYDQYVRQRLLALTFSVWQWQNKSWTNWSHQMLIHVVYIPSIQAEIVKYYYRSEFCFYHWRAFNWHWQIRNKCMYNCQHHKLTMHTGKILTWNVAHWNATVLGPQPNQSLTKILKPDRVSF